MLRCSLFFFWKKETNEVVNTWIKHGVEHKEVVESLSHNLSIPLLKFKINEHIPLADNEETHPQSLTFNDSLDIMEAKTYYISFTKLVGMKV